MAGASAGLAFAGGVALGLGEGAGCDVLRAVFSSAARAGAGSVAIGLRAGSGNTMVVGRGSSWTLAGGWKGVGAWRSSMDGVGGVWGPVCGLESGACRMAGG